MNRRRFIECALGGAGLVTLGLLFRGIRLDYLSEAETADLFRAVPRGMDAVKQLRTLLEGNRDLHIDKMPVEEITYLAALSLNSYAHLTGRGDTGRSFALFRRVSIGSDHLESTDGFIPNSNLVKQDETHPVTISYDRSGIYLGIDPSNSQLTAEQFVQEMGNFYFRSFQPVREDPYSYVDQLSQQRTITHSQGLALYDLYGDQFSGTPAGWVYQDLNDSALKLMSGHVLNTIVGYSPIHDAQDNSIFTDLGFTDIDDLTAHYMSRQSISRTVIDRIGLLEYGRVAADYGMISARE